MKEYGKKVNLSRYGPGGALGVRKGLGYRISRHSAQEGGKVVSPTHRPSLPPGRILVLISVRGWVDPRVTMRPEGLSHWKTPVTPSGIEPATFRFVAQWESMGHWWNNTDRENPKNSSKILSQWHFAHQNSYRDWREVNPGLPGKRPMTNSLRSGTFVMITNPLHAYQLHTDNSITSWRTHERTWNVTSETQLIPFMIKFGFWKRNPATHYRGTNRDIYYNVTGSVTSSGVYLN